MPLNKLKRIGEIEGSSKDIRFLIGSSEDALLNTLEDLS